VTDRDEPRARRWRVALLAGLGTGILRLLGSTWRVRRTGNTDFDAMLARREPFVVIFWHGNIIPITWCHRGQPFWPLISTHADGELIARVVQALGYGTVRGSSSRGGTQALRDMLRLLGEGKNVVVTPDGPRGPRHSFSPGALIAAWRTGRCVIAIRATANRAWRTRSWDRHLVPKPFATVTIHYSAAQAVRAASLREVEDEAPRFARLLAALANEPDDHA
jgi:lysophospholipid acyltransferase (LPLAT)-like uncharacterized protein